MGEAKAIGSSEFECVARARDNRRRHKSKVLIVWASFITIMPTIALAAAAPPPDPWKAFTKEFDTYVGSNKIVGGSALFLAQGNVVARLDYGYADRDTGRRITSQTIFHWGSITKTLTAIAILQLRDRG